ncbi:MAG: DUF2490 domain-containing protein [Prevotellaceae bacterium]|jgi:hypothetical protein|nr:DUF2490 domain-containing protein [Prevotellaceae bacterium]
MSTPSCRALRATCLLVGMSISAFAQPPRAVDAGAAFAVEVEKELSRLFSVTGKEEVRLINNSVGFDRSVTSLGFGCSFFDKRVKVGACYAFLHLYNGDNLFEPRHRCYLNLSLRETFGPFTLSWRGRLQSTLRNESRGEYSVNPKRVLKNKVEVAYAIWGSPWKPYLSCDVSATLNDPVAGYEWTRLRFQGGASWRLNRTAWLDFFLRFDELVAYSEPQAVWLGATCKIKLPHASRR